MYTFFCLIDRLAAKFDKMLFESFESSWMATEVLIGQMKANKNILTHTPKNKKGEFLYNSNAKTAVLLKYIIKDSKRQYDKKRNKRYKNPEDIGKRITTTLVAKNLISGFFNCPKFEEFVLAVPVGSHIHEAVIFFRKQSDKMDATYFNPNYSKAAQRKHNIVVLQAV